MYLLSAQAARALVVLGSAQGSLQLIDPRADFRPQHAIAAHGAGLSDLDARGDLLATCGYAMRHGQIATENYVKVSKGQKTSPDRIFHLSPNLKAMDMLATCGLISLLIAARTGNFLLAHGNPGAFSKVGHVTRATSALSSFAGV